MTITMFTPMIVPKKSSTIASMRPGEGMVVVEPEEVPNGHFSPPAHRNRHGVCPFEPSRSRTVNSKPVRPGWQRRPAGRRRP
jgi:hypothetical protein